jgi:hypothetical protein
MTLPNT